MARVPATGLFFVGGTPSWNGTWHAAPNRIQAWRTMLIWMTGNYAPSISCLLTDRSAETAGKFSTISCKPGGIHTDRSRHRSGKTGRSLLWRCADHKSPDRSGRELHMRTSGWPSMPKEPPKARKHPDIANQEKCTCKTVAMDGGHEYLHRCFQKFSGRFRGPECCGRTNSGLNHSPHRTIDLQNFLFCRKLDLFNLIN